MSPQLKSFYKAAKAHLEGEPNSAIFYGFAGLCYALCRWCDCEGIDWHPLKEEMEDQFIAAGLNKIYPFNKPDGFITQDIMYSREADMGKTYTNLGRVNWIMEHAQ